MRPAGREKRQWARIVELLRDEAAERHEQAAAIIGRCPTAFACMPGSVGAHENQMERDRIVQAYLASAALGRELDRVADLIEKATVR